MINYINYSKYISAFFDLIFPPKCIFCGSIMSIGTKVCICQTCEAEIPFVRGNTCRKCGQPMEAFAQNSTCFDCRRNKHEYVEGISVFEYKGKVKRAIVKLKFYGKKKYAQTLGYVMSNKIKVNREWPSFDLIVCTPLHKKRYAERGYNQAGLLAKIIADELGIDFCNNVLIKIKQTKSQNKLTRAQRLVNINNAFKVNNNEIVKDLCILLIDDVYTTGTTVDECAKTLKLAGASSIYVCTAAIGKGID